MLRTGKITRFAVYVYQNYKYRFLFCVCIRNLKIVFTTKQTTMKFNHQNLIDCDNNGDNSDGCNSLIMIDTIKFSKHVHFSLNAIYYWIISSIILIQYVNIIESKSRIPDMCENESVDSAVRIRFEDHFERYFLSNGHYYWLYNLDEQSPNERIALRIPYNFEPDVAIVKDTSQCSKGYRSILLIQMKITSNRQAEWFQLEMKINRWNSTTPIFWNEIQKIANCDLEKEICTATDPYFMTMAFDFKRKLDGAFGVIGDIAYFIQGDKVFKVLYKNQCIDNPYAQVIAYPGLSIGTTTTAALVEPGLNDTIDIILFDRDLHYRLANQENLADVHFTQNIAEPSNWQPNNPYYFKTCQHPNIMLGLNTFVQDLFTDSKRHYYLRRIIFAIFFICLICIFLLAILLLIRNNRNQKKKQSDHKQVAEKETQPKELEACLQINVDTETGKMNGNSLTVLQTNC
uniref:Uncharacterized protein LOC113797952 n=1 Tax=Dermatophagoides pteronyssinus TaxID=6956 RepID=A0A6P6YHE9_DERPT|nr:uncharacterized protein LOC113797952 [Dermatophagoides pteronyssinus]